MSTSWSRLQAWRQDRGVSSRAAAICAGGWLECLWAGKAWRRAGAHDVRMIARLRSRPRNVQLAGMCCIHRSGNLDFMLRCLIVDDNSRFLAAARCWLERQEITVVGLASTATEALQQTAELHPDVVLVDIDLGSESGFELANQLQGNGGLDSSPVILISAYAEEDYAELIAASPAVGFLSKTALSGQKIRDLVENRAGQRLR